MPTLYVIRHAEPEISGKILGKCDPHLSSAGRRKAANLKLPDCIVYSSPLRRSVETAEFLCSNPIIIPGFAEISYGMWDGLSWDRIEREWPEIAQAKLVDWRGVTPPGGEDWVSFEARVEHACSIVLGGGLPAAIVAHEAVNAIIANRVAGADFQKYQQEYCEIKEYEL